jgi:hypothetical protein
MLILEGRRSDEHCGLGIGLRMDEIAAMADVITDLYVTSDPCFSTGFSSSTNVGRGL